MLRGDDGRVARQAVAAGGGGSAARPAAASDAPGHCMTQTSGSRGSQSWKFLTDVSVTRPPKLSVSVAPCADISAPPLLGTCTCMEVIKDMESFTATELGTKRSRIVSWKWIEPQVYRPRRVHVCLLSCASEVKIGAKTG